jgi:hypothetical protein
MKSKQINFRKLSELQCFQQVMSQPIKINVTGLLKKMSFKNRVIFLETVSP